MPESLLIAILAAGASRRLGQPKQLVNVGGEPLLRRQARVAIESGLGPVTAILGCEADACEAALAPLQLSVRRSQHWQEGLAASIREATQAALDLGSAGLLILHGDQYRVTAPDLQRLHGAWAESGGSKVCRSRCEGYTGPPVIFPARCFPDLLSLQGDEGARRVIAAFGPECLIDVEAPNAAYDLDLPEQLADLARL